MRETIIISQLLQLGTIRICIFKWFQILLLVSVFSNARENNRPFPPVQMKREKDHVLIENGIVNVTFTVPGGTVTNIQYNDIANLLEKVNKYDNRGYWDVVWAKSNDSKDIIDKLEGTSFHVVVENHNQVEISFRKTYNPSISHGQLPINIDKRFILLRGYPGFYSYAIFERLKGWPAINVYQGRIVFKLQQNLFQFMAVGDDRQRIMPSVQDRLTGEVLDYPEAVRLTNPRNKLLRGDVDDKYQYSSDNKDSRVHGWICGDPPTGFWMITPSNEFKTAGPMKQDLTSHVGPTTLSMFFSTHYAGAGLGIKFKEGEAWKKVFGPVSVYLNSVRKGVEPLTLWADAKKQMLTETGRWPFDFPQSKDYSKASQRGTVSGRLLVSESYVKKKLVMGNSAYVGLAPPGAAGSWQNENKGYQFWTQADKRGYFVIKNIRAGNYSLYAWVPGFIGDYKSDAYIIVVPGQRKTLGNLVYKPPRNGPTLWEIGKPDRTAMEFFIPDPNPRLRNQLYTKNPRQKFRQYGLWDQYTQTYPHQDLIFTVGVDNYRTNWFFAHVNRKVGNKSYVPTTWQIVFHLKNVKKSSNYSLRLALASANDAELQVRMNDANRKNPHFTTRRIGNDNAIARHGIHGLYWLFNVRILGSQLVSGKNVIFLKQTRGFSPWKGLMYDYIRFEGPSHN